MQQEKLLGALDHTLLKQKVLNHFQESDKPHSAKRLAVYNPESDKKEREQSAKPYFAKLECNKSNIWNLLCRTLLNRNLLKLCTHYLFFPATKSVLTSRISET